MHLGFIEPLAGGDELIAGPSGGDGTRGQSRTEGVDSAVSARGAWLGCTAGDLLG